MGFILQRKNDAGYGMHETRYTIYSEMFGNFIWSAVSSVTNLYSSFSIKLGWAQGGLARGFWLACQDKSQNKLGISLSQFTKI